MKRAFTLIELLIVITIIGILAVAFLPQLLGAPSKARDQQRIDALNTYVTGLTPYLLEYGLDQMPDRCIIINNDDPDEGMPQEMYPLFGGQPPVDPQDDNYLPASPGGEISEETNYCATGFGVILNPSSDYDYGLYSHMENFESANAECLEAYEGNIVAPGESTDPTNYCYAVLIAL